ncbi:MAG: hypothetical protein ACOX0C_02675 [Patescibacteria group bacterium]|jgi:hypothetical protein
MTTEPKPEKHYFKRRRDHYFFKSRWNMLYDLSLAGLILLLLGLFIAVIYFRPEFSDRLLSWSAGPKYQLDEEAPPLVVEASSPRALRDLTEAVELELELFNDSPIELKDIKVNLNFPDRQVSLDKLELAEGELGVVINNNELLISKLTAQESLNLKLILSLRSRVESLKLISWQAELEYLALNQTLQKELKLDNIQLASQLTGSAEAYYHSPQGDQLGTGPLPPLVAIPTNYWIFFKVQGNGDFKDLVFSGKLAPGVELTGKRSVLAGNFTYNASLRQMVWTLPELSGAGDSYRLGFEVRFIPSEGQLGKIPTLVNEVKYYAYDPIIAEVSHYNLNNVTTNLDYDHLSRGQGTVALP